MTYLAHAVRRGLEHTSSAGLIKRATNSLQFRPQDIPKWGGVTLFVTFWLFVIALIAVEYTLGVVARLAMIETPSSSITVTAPADATELDDSKQGLLETGPAITLVAEKPLTSSIRKTVRHLRTVGGRLAPWRGFGPFLAYHMLSGIVLNVLATCIPRFPGQVVIVSAFTGALLSPIHALWTHKLIAMPTKLSWRKRMLSLRDWKYIALPAALAVSAEYIAVYATMLFSFVIGMDKVREQAPTTGREMFSVALLTLSVVAFFFACALFLVLPAHVTLVRIEASLLADEHDTIVPFDRTFAGKVVSKVLGGTGAVGFVDAWKSFNWEARRRLIKLWFKAMAIESLMIVAFVHVILFEVWIFLGTAFIKALERQQQAGSF
ncbi:uncharacterized protein EI97DRAFT_432729 [Westerdykella ornata]|uniref:Uncharacterized protein n=1 Tax=Westerdykella ornata TaxID=318751 RepID=A0A6A6JLX7_WESOR|nr:uncharacterized protein EI97DRAFT_432729 [Westerdykella ornata]KAF2277113.1 hypothetical protein EI97DRAFT_432729 [Westerdykella ornata]